MIDTSIMRAAIIGEHYECEDSWYSCPVSDEGCVNPGAGEECTCGVDTRRILLDKLLKTARQEALRECEGALQAANKAFELLAVIEAHKECVQYDTQMPTHPVADYIPSGVAKAWEIVKAQLDRLASEGG